MRSYSTYIAWFSVAAALAALIALVYFVQRIGEDELSYAQARVNAQEQATRDAARARADALVRDTTLERASLEHYLSADVLTVAQILTDAGKSAGTSPQLSDALPEPSPSIQPASGPQLHAIGFVVQASGTFAALMHTERLFETLPLAASVERFDITRSPSASVGQDRWSMNVYIRVLTTASVSS